MGQVVRIVRLRRARACARCQCVLARGEVAGWLDLGRMTLCCDCLTEPVPSEAPPPAPTVSRWRRRLHAAIAGVNPRATMTMAYDEAVPNDPAPTPTPAPRPAPNREPRPVSTVRPARPQPSPRPRPQPAVPRHR